MCTHVEPKIGRRSRSHPEGSVYQRAGSVVTRSTGMSLLTTGWRRTAHCGEHHQLALDDAIGLAERLADIPATGEPGRREQHGSWREVVAHTIVSGHGRPAGETDEDLVVTVAARREAAERGFPHADVQSVVHPQLSSRLLRLALDRVG